MAAAGRTGRRHRLKLLRLTKLETADSAHRSRRINRPNNKARRREAQQQLNSARAAARQAKADADLVAAAGGKVLRTDDGKTAILVQMGASQPKWMSWIELKDASEQADNGDGLAPFYAALYRIARRMLA